MTVIAQRELRNRVSDVLRRAERGEHFVVTVDGRAVATLGPLPVAHEPASPERLAALLRDAPVDAVWAAELAELREADAAAARDPWSD